MSQAYATGSRGRGTRAVTGRHGHWYRGAIVRGGRKGFAGVLRRAREAPPRAPRSSALVGVLACALLAGGCGGGTRQDAGEPTGTFAMRIVGASFPAAQTIARQTRMVLLVRNSGARTVPNLAVTIDSFDYTSNYPDLAANKRPVWAVERGPGAIASPPVESQEVSRPGGGQTAYVNTWTFGPLAPGKTRVLVWRVVPVKPGAWTVHYSVAPGLSGKSKAALPNSSRVNGRFHVQIAPAPPLTHVNPHTGRVEVGQFPASP
jgi:hypothetical protein